MTDINDIIRSMAEAKSAMDRVPELTKDNETLAATVAQLEATRKQHEDRIAELELNFEQSQKDLAAKAEAHSAATFRENEVRSRLETFQSLVSGALSQVTPKVEETAIASDGHSDYDLGQSASPLPEPSAVSTSSEPDVNSTLGSSPETVAPSTSNAPTPEPLAAFPTPPYYGLPDWRKPHSLSWGEWRQGGGEAPLWVSDLDH